MKRTILPEENKWIQKRRLQKRWHKVVAVLGLAVALGTVYALALPAVTLEKECQFPEHTHDDSCYTQILSVTETVPHCAAEVHTHTASCYGAAGELRCGYADFLVHRHDSACYDESGKLWCTLPEIDAHTHTDVCYTPGHTHDDSCYTQERGALTCTLHAHTEDCWTETENLVCGESETPEHTHSESCYETTRELTCGIESDHVHTDECYAAEARLTCGQAESTEPVLVCGVREITLHRHTHACYDANGGLVCGKLQILRHQHGEECFRTEEVPVDTQTLTCTDETHVHTARCYGTWELTCGMEEHAHGLDCTPPEATEETEAMEETEAADETAPEGVPSGLPVMGTAYAAQGPRRVMAVALTGADDPAEGETVTAAPVNVEGYIKQDGTKLEYRVDGIDWRNVEGVNNIPGNAEFKLTVKYANVPITDLLAAGGKMTYTLPEIFRDAKADGAIHDAFNQPIGTITASGQTATITFQEQWLAQQEVTNSVIDGDFYVQGKADLSQIPNGGDTTVTIGDVTINVNFAGDLIAQYGDVKIEKTVAQTVTRGEDGKDYLKYTLKVTAGRDGCPEVKVTDTFGTGKDWVDGYVLPENATNATVGEDGTLTWVIGTMVANQKIELSYQVKLKDGYTGGQPKGNIQNTATVFSKTYDRNSATATFTPETKATLVKGILGSINGTKEGNLELTYYVWVTAKDSSYTLRDVVIKDSLDDSVLHDGVCTKPELRKYMYYKEDSFKLYQGGDGSANQNNLTTVYTAEPSGHLTFNESKNDSNKPNGAFEYHVGALKPNESRTLVYTVVIEPGFFTVAGNNTEIIKNRVQIYWVDENNQAVLMPGQRWFVERQITRKAWSRKVVGQAQTKDVTVDMTGGSVYDSDGTTTDNTPSFIAPEGSYQYQVLVNEAGDWDLSSAQLKDTLSSYMTFVGYVKVDAFHIDQEAPASSLADQAALDYFAGQDPAETFWVKVDNQTSFSIQPKVCTDRSNHAYRLTYYAQPNATGTVLVTNEFELSGTVGYGGKDYTLAGIKASAQVTVSGDNSFGAQKHALFYEPAQVTEGNYSKGTLYWAIQVDGKSLPAGFALRDTPADGTDITGNHIHEDSLIGVYTGATGLTLSDNKTLDALQNQLTVVDSGSYTAERQEGQPLTVTFTDAMQLDGKSLYVLVKTEPDALPEKPRDVLTYSNGLQTSSAEGNWVDHNSAQQTLYGKATIFKELADVFTTDGNSITFSTSGKSRADYDVNWLPGPGKYVGWLIHLNYAGTLDGTYRVEEQIPQGMEVAYIRMYWYGPKVQNETPKSEMAPISDLGSEWQENVNTSTGNNTGSRTNYYYVNGQNAIMEVTNLFPGGGYRDDYAVELQIVCKLTDPAVLLGGAEKTFNNTVTLRNPNGDVIDTAASGVTLSVPQMQKGKDNTATVSGGNYPFTIRLNQEGIDLMPKSDTITLVDELGGNLTIDISSITVKNSNTDQPLPAGSWSSSVETANGKQTLKIVLPDDQPLTISYTTAVNAPPGKTVTVQNNAHWEGYATTTGGSVNDESFQYQAGGTAGAAATPQILISKVNQYNNQQKLADATFQLTEMVLKGDVLKETATMYEGTTDANGSLTFGTASDQILKYNTVYQIREKQAPVGYVLDNAPHYVLIAQKVNGEYPDFTQYQGLDVTVTIHYATPQYTYTAFNHKGEIEVTKVFQNADGTELAHRNGTYRFGLFADAAGTKLLQETYVTYAYGNLTASAKFTDVAFGKTYYVFELNDQGEPIPGGQPGTVGGVPFVVSYDSTGITVTAQAPGGKVTVTNRLNYAELPRTGGSGTAGFTVLGILLIAASLTLFAVKRRKEPRS